MNDLQSMKQDTWIFACLLQTPFKYNRVLRIQVQMRTLSMRWSGSTTARHSAAAAATTTTTTNSREESQQSTLAEKGGEKKGCRKHGHYLPMKATNQRYSDDRVTAATRPLHLYTDNTLNDSSSSFSSSSSTPQPANNQQITICPTFASSNSHRINRRSIRLAATANYPFRGDGRTRVEPTRLIRFPYRPASIEGAACRRLTQSRHSLSHIPNFVRAFQSETSTLIVRSLFPFRWRWLEPTSEPGNSIATLKFLLAFFFYIFLTMFFGLIISLKTLFKSVQHSGSEDINHLRRWRPSNSIKAPDWPRRGIAPNPPSENGLESVQVSPRRTRQDRSRLLGNRGKQMPWKHRGSIVEDESFSCRAKATSPA